jgi:DNA polymerase-1
MGLFNEKTINEFNPNSNKQILEILSQEGIHLENTSKHELIPYIDHPFVRLLLEYRQLEKQLNTFLYTLPEHLNPNSKRLHPRYGQNGAFSGRMSCGNPNIQQIPRGKEFRACFNAPHHRKLVIADYSQIELRVIAEYAKDETMIKAYKEGEDLHRLTASLILQKDLKDITKEERQAAKAVNFGLVFGMGAAGLQAYAADTYGAKMTMDEAQVFKKRYFQAYKGLNQWQLDIKRSLPISSRTLAGRKHNYSDDAGLSARFNTPIQGTAADILKNALGQLYLELKETNTFIVAVVHDEIVLECDENKSLEIAALLKKVMEEAGNRYLKRVPVIAEVVISDSWAGK